MNIKDFSFGDLMQYFGATCCIITLILILSAIVQRMVFRIEYSFPTVTQITATPINTSNDPVQIYVNPRKLIKYEGEKDNYALETLATYSISGLIVAKNTNFWIKEIDQSAFDDVALMDVGIVWGNMADKDTIQSNMEFKSYKTLGSARTLQMKPKREHTLGIGYMLSHSSHTHLIPNDINVMSALLALKKYENVRLEGYLVDIRFPKGGIAYTSDSRSDNNAESRGTQILLNSHAAGGGGACEIMYVTQVQIGNKIYR